jgi:hypothetical protein
MFMNKKLLTSIVGLAMVAAILVVATTIAVAQFGDDQKAYAKKDKTNKNNGSGPVTAGLPLANKEVID